MKPVHLRIDSSGLSVHVGQWRTPPPGTPASCTSLALDCIVTSEHDHVLTEVVRRIGLQQAKQGGDTKAILGSAMRARGLASQRVEVRWGGEHHDGAPEMIG